MKYAYFFNGCFDRMAPISRETALEVIARFEKKTISSFTRGKMVAEERFGNVVSIFIMPVGEA